MTTEFLTRCWHRVCEHRGYSKNSLGQYVTPEGRVCVLMLFLKRFGKPEARSLVSHTDHLVVITRKLTYDAREAIRQRCLPLEVHSPQMLEVDVLDHELVPRYRVLGESEVVALERRFGSRLNFPKLLAQEDVVARLMYFQHGQVLEVSPKSGGAIYYRYVMDNPVISMNVPNVGLRKRKRPT